MIETATMKQVTNKYGTLAVYRRPKFIDGFAKTIENLTYEADVVRLLETLNYDVFIDVGSCFGYHSLVASPHCERVLAFEPHPIRYGFLWWNVRNNENISPYSMAVGDVQVYVEPSINNMGGIKNKTRSEELDVERVRLDDIIASTEGVRFLVKIDTEGFELDVLRSYTGSGHNVAWIVEQHSWNTSEEQLQEYFGNRKMVKLERRENAETFLWFVDYE